MDLTKNTPRSAREKVLGVVQLARTIDKAKASVHGQLGEYEFPCPMDRNLFDFLGIQDSAFTDFVKHAKSEAEIVNFAKGSVEKKSTDEIADFNRRAMTAKPTGESLEHFTALRSSIAPERTDVSTWPDLLDLEEGRPVAVRQVPTKV
jgi:hypothetical protein